MGIKKKTKDETSNTGTFSGDSKLQNPDSSIWVLSVFVSYKGEKKKKKIYKRGYKVYCI